MRGARPLRRWTTAPHPSWRRCGPAHLRSASLPATSCPSADRAAPGSGRAPECRRRARWTAMAPVAVAVVATPARWWEGPTPAAIPRHRGPRRPACCASRVCLRCRTGSARDARRTVRLRSAARCRAHFRVRRSVRPAHHSWAGHGDPPQSGRSGRRDRPTGRIRALRRTVATPGVRRPAGPARWVGPATGAGRRGRPVECAGVTPDRARPARRRDGSVALSVARSRPVAPAPDAVGVATD